MYIMRIAPVILALLMVMNAYAADVEAVFGSERKLRDFYREAIIDADDTIRVAMDIIEDEWLISALTDAEGRGREVQIILDPEFARTPEGARVAADLRSTGCEVVGKGGTEALISRFVIIDGETVIVGSYPFSNAAEETPLNDAVVITDEKIVKGYTEFFDYCWNTAK